jgi:hypothetical protein
MALVVSHSFHGEALHPGDEDLSLETPAAEWMGHPGFVRFKAFAGVIPVTAARWGLGRPYFGFLKKTPRLTRWEILGNISGSSRIGVWSKQVRATGGW